MLYNSFETVGYFLVKKRKDFTHYSAIEIGLMTAIAC
jgi:hypothetical protein